MALKTETLFISQALDTLAKGISTFVQEMRSQRDMKFNAALSEIENLYSFLETLGLIKDTMPEERICDAVRNSVRSFMKLFKQMPEPFLKTLKRTHLDPESLLPRFVNEVYSLMGPSIRISENQMAAWVRIDADDASFLQAASVMENLEKRGITAGVDADKVIAIFQNSLFSQEIPIARGVAPKPGVNGSVEYCIHLEDLGRAPKVIDKNRVSYKDIEMFKYVGCGDLIAKKVPPVPGQPGRTVTGRIIPCIEPREAEFLEIKNTKISDDGNDLLSTIDGCVTKRNGLIELEPCLRVKKVSYESGNIQSKVTVIVTEGVLSGFSVESDENIFIEGVVEGAHLKSKKNIVVKGGILGKEKALIEAEGDVTSKYIANATVINEGNILVEAEILQSKLWSGGQIVVSNANGKIVGGEIDADFDILADILGSDLGVRTVIRIGGRTADLSALISETEEKITEQENAAEKCRLIIETLELQMQKPMVPVEDMKKALHQAREMLHEAQTHVNELQNQYDQLAIQFEESQKHARTIRGRKTILPGTLLEIQGVQLDVKEATGPSIVVRQEDRLVFLPYKDIPGRP